MPEETKYYEGLYMVRVLSDRPQGEAGGPEDVAAIMRECETGDFVGDLVFGRVEEVNAIHMAELLNAAGSEPEFFGLQDAATFADALYDSADDAGCSGDLVVVSKQELNALLKGVGFHEQMFETEEDEG